MRFGGEKGKFVKGEYSLNTGAEMGEVFDGGDWPKGNFAEVGADCWNVEEKEEDGEDSGNPDDEPVDLLEGDAEHVGQVSVGEQLPEVCGLDVQ